MHRDSSYVDRTDDMSITDDEWQQQFLFRLDPRLEHQFPEFFIHWKASNNVNDHSTRMSVDHER